MTPDESLWQRLEADFARVLGEIPKPEGPDVDDEGRGRRERADAGVGSDLSEYQIRAKQETTHR